MKLKQCDWLQEVCFEPAHSPTILRQYQYLNQVKDIDKLLISSFELLDINEVEQVSQILEDSA